MKTEPAAAAARAGTKPLTLPARLREFERLRPGRVALREKKLGIWREITWAEYFEHTREAGLGLVSLGLRPGDRVAIHSENRPEWIYADLGTEAVQAVTAGIYPTNPANEVAYILRNSGARFLVAEDQEQVDKALAASAECPELEKIVYIEREGVEDYDDPRLISWDELLERGRGLHLAEPSSFDELIDDADPSDCATIVYTSGTTGPPKGAMLSHANMITTSDYGQEAFATGESDELLSYLPLCHVAEKIFTLITPLSVGARVSFAESIDSVQPDLREIQPTIFLGVPRVWEKMQAGVQIRSEDLRTPSAPGPLRWARRASLVSFGIVLLWFLFHSFRDSANAMQRGAKYAVAAISLGKALLVLATLGQRMAPALRSLRVVHLTEGAIAVVFLSLDVVDRAPSIEALAVFLVVAMAFIVPSAYILRNLKWWNHKLWMATGFWVADARLRRRGAHTVGTRLLYAAGWVFLYRTLKSKLGMRRCRYALSGAAPIAPEVLRFLFALGIPVVEGYGLTESTGLGTLTRHGDQELGTVGTPAPSVEVKILDDGEICLRGPSMFMGYWRNPEATASSIDPEGFLHTGDVGEMTPTGHLRIVDRKKDIIITAGGRNLSPSEIENKLKISPYIREAVVIGDRRKFLSALIGIEFETVADWATRHDIPYTTYRDLSSKPEVVELILREVEMANRDLAQVESVKTFRLLPKELDPEDAELTATQKVKRNIIEKKFGDLVESMYK